MILLPALAVFLILVIVSWEYMIKPAYHFVKHHVTRVLRKLRRKRPHTGRGLTFLIPFRGDGNERSLRETTLNWLLEYYKDALPQAQFILGSTDDVPFNKCAAFNDAARKATGDIFVCMDADCFISTDVIVEAAQSLRRELKHGIHRWTVPYNKFYRLTQRFSEDILESSPKCPLPIPNPPEAWMVDCIDEKASSWGHQFGALIQIMPRAAFEAVGGFDERHRSWGSDDVDMMKALDTLYGPHHIMRNPVFHLWHPHLGVDSTERHWIGGEAGSNNWLATKYSIAYGNKARMQALIDEGIAERESK
jgi:hypothetical protein